MGSNCTLGGERLWEQRAIWFSYQHIVVGMCGCVWLAGPLTVWTDARLAKQKNQPNNLLRRPTLY
jgi:hypothetical protein